MKSELKSFIIIIFLGFFLGIVLVFVDALVGNSTLDRYENRLKALESRYWQLDNQAYNELPTRISVLEKRKYGCFEIVTECH